MAVTVINIVPRKFAETAITAQYTSSGGTTIIDKLTATNVGTVNVNFSCWLVASGGSSANDNKVLDARTIAPGETYLCPELLGQVLLTGGFLTTEASVLDSITISGAGRIITA